MRIEIRENHANKEGMSFDLIINGEKILEDTGLGNCTQYAINELTEIGGTIHPSEKSPFTKLNNKEVKK